MERKNALIRLINKYIVKIRLFKIAATALIVIILSSSIYIVRYQQLVDVGSSLADDQCLNVNPYMIAKRQHYINSIEIIQASGSVDDYWKEIDMYLSVARQYIDAQSHWLENQKKHMSQLDFKLIVPSYMKRAARLQYDSREADLKATEALVELLEKKDSTDEVFMNELSETVIAETERAKRAEQEYTDLWDSMPGKNDLRKFFINIPESRCPAENFDLPK